MFCTKTAIDKVFINPDSGLCIPTKFTYFAGQKFTTHRVRILHKFINLHSLQRSEVTGKSCLQIVPAHGHFDETHHLECPVEMDCLNTYDLQICQVAYTSQNERLFVHSCSRSFFFHLSFCIFRKVLQDCAWTNIAIQPNTSYMRIDLSPQNERSVFRS